MAKIKVILCLVICLCMGTQVFAFDSIDLSQSDIKSSLEKKYGFNIIIPDEDGKDFNGCLLILEKSLKKFPDNIIKEITDYYLKNGYVTNVIIDKTENIEELFAGCKVNDTTNIYINTLESSLNSGCFVSEEVVLHELGHFISNYLFEFYDFEKIKNEFELLNQGLEYGTWEKDYNNVFVNKHSANSFEDEVADLIWYAEANPSNLRNINEGNDAVIHKKLMLLQEVLEQGFESINTGSNLWLDATPQEPLDWAKDIIKEMKDLSLIPEEFDGLYQSNITREDFYKLVLNMLHKKFGEESLNEYFNLTEFESYVILDPVNGEVFVNDGMNYSSYYNLLKDNKEILYQAYNMGILSQEVFTDSEGYMTRLEIAKILVYIGSQLGKDITDFNVIDYIDIGGVDDTDKPYIYIAASRGYLRGDGLNFKPYDYCTYQEAYIIIMRIYNNLM